MLLLFPPPEMHLLCLALGSPSVLMNPVFTNICLSFSDVSKRHPFDQHYGQPGNIYQEFQADGDRCRAAVPFCICSILFAGLVYASFLLFCVGKYSKPFTNTVMHRITTFRSTTDHIYDQTKLNSVALVRERTILTERPPPVGEVSANFCR